MVQYGDRFGRLVVTGSTRTMMPSGRSRLLFDCVCDCGNKTSVQSNHLRSGATKSCGCYSKDRARLTRLPKFNLEGMRFGRLVVLHVSGRNRGIVWLCQCDCGKFKNVKGIDLKGPHGTRSCGCLNSERLARLAQSRRAKDPWVSECHHYYLGATKRGLCWSLTVQEFKDMVLSVCHYCGAPPNQKCHVAELVEKGVSKQGIDRKDPAHGYTIENSVPCCAICNFAKLSFSYVDFIKSTRRRYEHMKSTHLMVGIPEDVESISGEKR